MKDFGWDKRTRGILVNLYDQGIIDRMRQNGNRLSREDVYDLVSVLEDRYGTAQRFVEEGIQLWADAMGAVVELPPPVKLKTEPERKVNTPPQDGPGKKPRRWGIGLVIAAFLVLGMIIQGVYSSGRISGHDGTINWTLKDGTLTISGSGPMRDYGIGHEELPPWAKNADICNTIKTVKIQNGVTRIGSLAFAMHHNLTDVTMANSVTEIGEWAFYASNHLYRVNLSENLRKIENFAFSDCADLTDLKIPGSVERIGWQAFDGTNLSTALLDADCQFTYASFPAETKIYNSYEQSGACGENAAWTLDESGLLTISGSGPILDAYDEYSGYNFAAPWIGFREEITAVLVEEGITLIGNGAFYGCNNLKEVTIAESVTELGNDAFGCCSALSGIRLPNGLTEIGAHAFAGCVSLKEIQIPGGVTSVGYGAFQYCERLKSVTIPNGLERINNDMFGDCKDLTSVNLPYGVTEIGQGAFENCVSLENISIPGSVTNILGSAFQGCESLTSVTIPKNCVFEENAAYVDWNTFPDWIEIKYQN